MSEKKKFDTTTLIQVAQQIAQQDASNPNYMSASQLVKMFGTLGYKDSYSPLGGLGIVASDLTAPLTRLSYTTARLSQLNEVYKMPDAIQRYVDAAQKPLEAVKHINDIVKSMNVSFATKLAGISPITADSVDEEIPNTDIEIKPVVGIADKRKLLEKEGKHSIAY